MRENRIYAYGIFIPIREKVPLKIKNRAFLGVLWVSYQIGLRN